MTRGLRATSLSKVSKSTKPDRQINPKQKKGTEDDPPLRKGLINRPDIPIGPKSIHSKDPKEPKGNPSTLGSGDPLKGLNVTKSKNLRQKDTVGDPNETKGDKVYTPHKRNY